jgi:hypothetical protein
VVGANHYDWALPGDQDELGNRQTGGIVIWRVDERRVAAGLQNNTVNADRRRRGIEVMEADGSQDIGLPAAGGPAVDLGTPFDFWFRGNPVRAVTSSGEVALYRNRFGPDTTPASSTNEGGPSFVVLEEFSLPGVSMTLSFSREGASGIVPVAGFEAMRLPLAPGEGGSLMLVQEGETAALVVYDGSASVQSAPSMWVAPLINGAPDGEMVAVDALGRPAFAGGQVAYFMGDEWPVPASPAVLSVVDAARLFADEGVLYSHPLVAPGEQARGRSPVVALEDGYYVVVAAGDGNGRLVRASVAGVDVVSQPGEDVLAVAASGAGIAYLTTGGMRQPGRPSWDFEPGTAYTGQPVFGRDATGDVVGLVPLPASAELLWLMAGGRVERVSVAGYAAAGGTLTRYPVLADLDGDGRLDALVVHGRRLLAFTQGGALVAGFPIDMAAESSAQPLVARLTDSGSPSIVVASRDGYIRAFDLGRSGRQVAGFPLSVGFGADATPALVSGVLYAVSNAGDVRAWRLAGASDVWWGQHFGGAANRGYVALGTNGPPVIAASLLDPLETYNWPNPVRDGETYIRFRTTEDSRVSVTIVDQSGALVERFDVERVPGGVPVERLWRTSAASGMYFARVTATTDAGRSESRLIRMAIIR